MWMAGSPTTRPKRFEAYGWHVVRDVDGHDPSRDPARPSSEARPVRTSPVLICCKTIIGFGAPNQGRHARLPRRAAGRGRNRRHPQGTRLGVRAFRGARRHLCRLECPGQGRKAEADWNERFAAYQAAHPELAAEFERRMEGELPADWDEKAAGSLPPSMRRPRRWPRARPRRTPSNGYAPLLPELLGGSADLAGSNLTIWSGSKRSRNKGTGGNYIYYGVREFGMSAIMNGIALHGGFIPFGATFLMFSEYARNALRMAALMKVPSIFVYTHDSIGLGEDGPTHQAVEQTATLRMIPNMSSGVPAMRWNRRLPGRLAIDAQDGPSCLIFSRQNLPHMARTGEQIARDPPRRLRAVRLQGHARGRSSSAPVPKWPGDGCRRAAHRSRQDPRGVHAVDHRPLTRRTAAYRESVLPSAVTARVAVEAGGYRGLAQVCRACVARSWVSIASANPRLPESCSRSSALRRKMWCKAVNSII